MRPLRLEVRCSAWIADLLGCIPIDEWDRRSSAKLILTDQDGCHWLWMPETFRELDRHFYPLDPPEDA